MARSYVIDGYNALYRLVNPVPESPDVGRRAIVERVNAILKTQRGHVRGGDKVHVVFDARKGGERGGTHGGGGTVSWSYASGSADEAIVEIVRSNEASHEGMQIVVVTDDRELRGRVKQLGAGAVRVHDWFDADAEEAGEPERAGPEATPGLRAKDFTPADFGMTGDAIDLDGTDPEDL